MHPFALNDEEIKQVGGALSISDLLVNVTSAMYGEEGGQPPIFLPPTIPLGEDGDVPPPIQPTP